MGDLGAHLHAKGSQVLGDQGRRAELPVPQLRMFVDVPPPGHDLCFDLTGTLVNGSAQFIQPAILG
jgi:hypothetical protein